MTCSLRAVAPSGTKTRPGAEPSPPPAASRSARSSPGRGVARSRPLPSFSPAYFIRKEKKRRGAGGRGSEATPLRPPSASYWPGLRVRHAETRQWRGAILRGGPAPSAEWAVGRCSSPAAARPPSLRRRCSTDAREPPPALPASSSSRTPETLSPLGSRPPPLPPPSLASYIVSASFSLLVEEGKKKNKKQPTIILREPPRPQKNKTRHEPGLALLRDWPSEEEGAWWRPHRRSREGSPRSPASVPAAGPSSARAPRPPAPRASRRVAPLSREPAEHTSVDGVARPGKVSGQLARAWRLFSSLAPGPGHGARGGRDPRPPHVRDPRPEAEAGVEPRTSRNKRAQGLVGPGPGPGTVPFAG